MAHPIAQPLRPLTEAERAELLRIGQAPTESFRRPQWAVALLAVAAGQHLTQAAHLAGWRVHDTVTRLVRRFNASGLAALDDQPLSRAASSLRSGSSGHGSSRNCAGPQIATRMAPPAGR